MKRALFLFFTGFLTTATGCANCSKSKPEPTADAGTTSAPVAASAPPTPTGFSVEACEQVLIMAEREGFDARQRASKACAKDADCALAESTVCIPGCADFAVAKKDLAAYDDSIAKTRAGKCKMWNGNGCPETTPKPKAQCSPKTAKCEDAKCVAR